MNKSKHYTLMFIPEDNGKTFTLRVHKYILRSILLFCLVFVLGLTLLLYKSGEIAAKLQLQYLMKLENDRLVEENKHLRLLSSKLIHVEQLSSYLERLAVPEKMIKNKEAKSVDVSSNAFVDNSNKGMHQKLLKAQQVPGSVAELSSAIPNITPVEGWITRQFSLDLSSGLIDHQGLDFAASFGTPIRSTASGTVDNIYKDEILGLVVTVRHDHVFMTKYGHCSQVLVSKHERVQRGQTVALVGNTGRSTAPHLHYEIVKDGKNVDPAKYLFVHRVK